MKPFIVICGIPCSFTSMVCKFLIDNGACTQKIWGKPKVTLSDHKVEKRAIYNYIENKKIFQNLDLKKYFENLPADKVVVSADPAITFWLDNLKKYTNRKIKVVFVIRNPERVILSSMEKSKKSFIFYFSKLTWMYQKIVSCPFEVFPIMPERIKKDGKRLLEFCELKTEDIIFYSIKHLKNHPANYMKYRLINFIWKKLNRLFRIY